LSIFLHWQWKQRAAKRVLYGLLRPAARHAALVAAVLPPDGKNVSGGPRRTALAWRENQADRFRAGPTAHPASALCQQVGSEAR